VQYELHHLDGGLLRSPLPRCCSPSAAADTAAAAAAHRWGHTTTTTQRLPSPQHAAHVAAPHVAVRLRTRQVGSRALIPGTRWGPCLTRTVNEKFPEHGELAASSSHRRRARVPRPASSRGSTGFLSHTCRLPRGPLLQSHTCAVASCRLVSSSCDITNDDDGRDRPARSFTRGLFYHWQSAGHTH